MPTGVQPATWAGRLAIARRFAVWRRGTDPQTEVPPAALLPHRYRRRPPRLYADQDVERIVVTASALPSSLGLRGPTYATLFGLLAVTGLRLSEGLHLDRADVDLEEGVLAIRRTKFGKSRLVRSTDRRKTRCAYAGPRPHGASPLAPTFFVSERRGRISEFCRDTFAKVSRDRVTSASLPPLRTRSAPDDLRHRSRRTRSTGIARPRRGARAAEARDVPRSRARLRYVWYLEGPRADAVAAERLITPH